MRIHAALVALIVAVAVSYMALEFLCPGAVEASWGAFASAIVVLGIVNLRRQHGRR